LTTQPAPLDEKAIATLLDFADCPPISGEVFALRPSSGPSSSVNDYIALGSRLNSSCPRCLCPLAPWKASESLYLDPTSFLVADPISSCPLCECPVPVVVWGHPLDHSITPEVVDAAVLELLLVLEAARDRQAAHLAARLQEVGETALWFSIADARGFVDFVLAATDDEVLPPPVVTSDLFAGISIDEATLTLSISALVQPPHYAGTDLAPRPELCTLYDTDVPAWQSDPAPLTLARREFARVLCARR